MKIKLKISVRALWLALCFLSAFFCCPAEVRAESGQLTHCHTGNRVSGGGCYGTKKTSTWTCNSYNVSVGFNGTDYIYVCGQCGARWSSPGKVDDPRCSAQVTETYYELNCGKTGAAAVSFSCEKSTQDWVKELDLTASYTVHENGISISGFLWNGSPGGESFHVTENGTYTLRLAGSGNVDFSTEVSVTVDHIDNTPPVIRSFRTVSEAWAASAELIVDASDSESGLAADAYSYDGGASWSSNNSFTVTENGVYSVLVRDTVGNISTAEASVSKIDRTPPVVSVSTSPSTENWYDGSLTVTVQAQDTESGLADAPYSFDGGTTYSTGSSAVLSGSGTLEIAVVDKAGNVTRLSFKAEKKQRPQPTPAPGSGTGTGNSGSGSGNGGTGGTGSGTGTDGSGTSGSGAAGAGNGAAGAGGSGAGAGSGSDLMENNGGTGSQSGGNGGTGSQSGGNGGTGSQSGGNGGTGSGVSGISGGTGNGNQNGQGSQNAGGTGKGSANGTGSGESGSAGTGTAGGSSISKDTGSGRYGSDDTWSGGTRSGSTGILQQHYPGGLPRVEAMLNGHQDETGNGSAGEDDGMSGTDRSDENGGVSEDDSAGLDGAGGVDVENAIIQNELLASANEQEAAVLQRTGAAGWTAGRYGGALVIAACAAVVTAAALGAWVMLFGIRVDTRDENGHYRFAGITRVTAKEQERLRVVPLTKFIVRNSRTNELRIRFGLLCSRRYEGETLLLRYRSMSREFKAERTVELHIRA